MKPILGMVYDQSLTSARRRHKAVFHRQVFEITLLKLNRIENLYKGNLMCRNQDNAVSSFAVVRANEVKIT